MTSSLKLINLAEKAKKIGPQFKIIGHRTTYFNRPIGLTNFEKKEIRISNVDSFKAYTEKILPQMEESIEIRLLRDRYNAINNPLLKTELLLAYKRRLLTISEMWKPREPFRAPEEATATPFYEPLDIYLKDIQNLTEIDIGKVIEFNQGDLEKYFSLSPLGDYATNQYKYSHRFCLQLTEEAFKLTNEMRKINAPRLTEEDFKKIFADVETTKDAKKLLDDEELYPRIFHDFALTFLDRLEPYRNDTLITKMFTESYLFDVLVNMLVRELISNTLRPLLVNQEKRAKIIDQILVQLKEKLHPEANPQRIQETLTPIKNFKIQLEAKDKEGKDRHYLILLKKYTTSPRALPSLMRSYGLKNFFGFNTGAIVTGMRGTGKSGVLMYTIMWAHKNNWIVVNPPSAYYLTQHRAAIKRHHDSGLYLEYEKARIFLQGFKEANQELIKDIGVNLELYGKYNLAGVHDNEPEPVPVTYDKERKVWSNDWERFLTANEKLFMQNERREMNVRLKQRLPEPKTLLEIVEHGIKEEMFAVNAIYELLEQLYNLESHRVLITADDYNYFFLPTCYPSFRYANSKGHESIIPAHHLALSRAFMKFDGHKIKNGVKIVAPGFKKLYKHTFDPSQINMGKGYTIPLTGLPLDDYRVFAEHLKQANIWMVGHGANISATEKLFLETQGNMHETITGILKPARAYE